MRSIRMQLKSTNGFISSILDSKIWGLPFLLSVILVAIAQYDGLTFHFLAEGLPIGISFTMFAVIWWMRQFKANPFLLFIACGYFWIGSLDLAHTMVYKGMNLFVVGEANLATQFWIGTRYLESLLLIAAPIFGKKKLNEYVLFWTFGSVSLVLFILILSGNFPTTFIEGAGLTDFKIYSEYLIIAMLALALLALLNQEQTISVNEKALIALAILFTMLAEFSFTLYVDIYGLSNIMGHLFKVFSFWFIFQAIVVYNFKLPISELDEFRTSLNGVVDGVTIFDAETLEISYVNEAVAKRVGTSIESIVGKTPEFVDPSFDIAKFRQAANSIVSGAARDVTYQVSHIDEFGAEDLREVTLQLLEAGGAHPRFISISRELGARKQAELAKAELEFQKLALDEHAIVSLTDVKGKITYVNDKLCEISGYSREELLGRNHNILRSGEHSDAFYKDMWETISDGRPWHGEVKNRRKSGEYCWVLSTIVPQLGEDGKPVNYINIRTDITKRKEAEKEILKFKQALDFSEDVVSIVWVDTLEYDYVNEAAANLLGVSRDSIIGLSVRQVSRFLDVDGFLTLAEPLLAGEVKSFSYEVSFEMADGVHLLKDIVVQLLKVDGERDRFFTAARDITDRKTAETEILRFKTTTDLSQDAIFFSTAKDRKIFYANKSASRYLGYSREELCNMRMGEVRAVQNNRAIQNVVSSLQENDAKAVIFETQHRHKNGKVIPVEVDLQLIEPDGQDVHILSVVRDLTDRKKTDHKVKLLQKALDSIADPVCMFWLDNLEFFYANNATASFSGYSNNEMIGSAPEKLFKEFDRTEFEKRYAQIYSGELTSITFELDQFDKHGNLREVEVLAQKLLNSDGRAYVVEIFRDISERKKVDLAKSEFISTVSHELRTPLTSIKGVLGLIKAGAFGGLPPKLLPMIDIAYDNSGRLEALIDDILDVEKIAAGGIELRLKPIDVSMFIGEALEANRVYSERNEVEYVVDAVEDHLIIYGDKSRLMQVMANLLSNAAKFSPARSKVEISANRRNDNICISIKDYGSGIPKEAQATIFDRFTQADSSDQREKGGTGLGLSISKSIIEGHVGTIWFTSKVGEGTTFYFEIPEYNQTEQDKDQ